MILISAFPLMCYLPVSLHWPQWRSLQLDTSVRADSGPLRERQTQHRASFPHHSALTSTVEGISLPCLPLHPKLQQNISDQGRAEAIWTPRATAGGGGLLRSVMDKGFLSLSTGSSYPHTHMCACVCVCMHRPNSRLLQKSYLPGSCGIRFQINRHVNEPLCIFMGSAPASWNLIGCKINCETAWNMRT